MLKKFLRSCCLILLLIGGSYVYYLYITSQNTPKIQDVKLNKSEETKQKYPSTRKQIQAENKHFLASKEADEKERQTFNKSISSQDYYLEKVDAKGKLTYIKATNESLKAFESKNYNKRLGTYQVNFEGRLISVLTIS